MYDMMSRIAGVYSALLQGYCMQYFFGEFLESRLPNRKWNGLLAAVSYGVLRLLISWALPFNEADSFSIIEKQAILFIMLLLLMLCFYRAVQILTLFLIVTFMAVSEISFFLSYMVIQMGNNLFNLWNWCFQKEYITSAAAYKRLIVMTAYGLQIFLCVVLAAILYISLKKIADSYQVKEYAIHRTELLFILTPGMAGLFICILLRMILVTVEDGKTKILYDTYPLLLWIVPAILLLLLLSILYGVKLFQDMIYRSREKNSRIILEKQIEGLQEHIREMEHMHSGIRSMEHDMKNTLAVVMQLAAGESEQEHAQLKAYLCELDQAVDRLKVRFQTGNTVVDTLLNMKYHEALRTTEGLRMDTQRLLFPESLRIQSFDIGIMIGNALDNAIEACRKLKEKQEDAKPFIRLYSYQKGNMFFIEIENSFDGNLILNRRSDFPATDKEEKESHGIGLLNIKNAAEQYHGAVDWSINQNVFTLSIMLQNERREV